MVWGTILTFTGGGAGGTVIPGAGDYPSQGVGL